MTNLQVHQRISLSRPLKSEHHYWLHTDGSGHQDGCGGASAVLIDCRLGAPHYRWMAQTGSTVERMELEALLMGLQMVIDLKPSHPQPRVWWVVDREALALSVWRHPDGAATQQPYYARTSAPDLWARFAYYESLLSITPQWVPRDTNQLHREADWLAGLGRNASKQAMVRILELYGVEPSEKEIKDKPAPKPRK